MALGRIVACVAALGCVVVLAGSATAAGEEIVVETSPLSPSSPAQWIDYSVAQTQAAWLLNANTCLKLLDYDEETGALRPEAAAAMPTASADGRTYHFTVGAGHRFFLNLASPPASEPVTAESFKRAIERATSPAMASSVGGPLPARSIMANVVGAQDFYTGAASSISGLQASGNLLMVQLVDPDPTFVNRIALPYFCATASGTPGTYSPFQPVPASAGPYFVSSAFASGTPPNLSHEIVLQRNPFYGGSRTRNLGAIRWVQEGSALAEDYRAAVPAGFTAPPGMFVASNVTTGVQMFALNTSKAPFNSFQTRHAAAYALNRVALSAVLGWQPTDQFVSPIIPGYAESDVYPLTGNPAVATTILDGATPSVTLCHPSGPRAQVASDAKAQLQAVGFQVTQVQPAGSYFAYIAIPANCDLALFNLSPDFLDPSRILEPLFRGGSTANFSFFDDPEYNARFAAAATMTPESARLTEYQHLDAHLSNLAVAIPIGYNLRLDAFSSRIGCRFASQVLFGYAVNRLCISVEQTAAAGGTVTTGSDASPSAPLQTAVEVPSGGHVAIVQGRSSTAAPPEYRLLEQRLDISAPTQTFPSFLTFTFELDASLLAGPPALTVNDVVPYRNGVPVPDCTGAGVTPDPCVASRTTDTEGDGVIVVHSTAASIWEFGERYDGTGAAQALATLAVQPGKVGDKAEDALAKLNAALAKLAQSPPDRTGAAGELEGAAGEVEAMVKGRLLTSTQARPLLVEIAGLARQLALQARQDAIDRGGSASKIAEAASALDQGDARWAASRFKDAVARYKDAVSKAEGA